jgi:lipopolysaccharide/colanic/teichoic acid biosynthesis glycosyltransferase
VLRWFDFVLSFCALCVLWPVVAILAVVGWFDNRSPFFFQTRVGQGQRPFTLVKFRTMRVGTASVATHLADPNSVSSWGSFLRRTKLDELPQLWNVMVGHMSLVGPRPCLLNQQELIAEREVLGVFKVKPGVTGLAQVQGVDMSTPKRLAMIDAEMIQQMSVRLYFQLIVQTALGRGSGDRIQK